jgi:hypothetical protein
MGLYHKVATLDGRWDIVDAHAVWTATVASEWMADAILQPSNEQQRHDPKLLENVAAISSEFHLGPDEYRAFYDSNADSLGGFPGIWRLMIDAGIAFTRAEPGDWEGTVAAREYLDAIMLFAERLRSDTVPLDRDSLYRLAQECIYGQRTQTST